MSRIISGIKITIIAAVVGMIASPMIYADDALPQFKVEGRVRDNKDLGVPFANVILLNAADSTFVQGTTTDDNGSFIITAPTDRGILKVSSIGYKTAFSYVSGEPVSVTLIEDAMLLNEVTVTSQRPKTVLTGNSMLTNVEGTILGNSGSAREMLSKVPGMTQRGDDIEVLGRGKPVYYINGRKLQDLDELKRLRSEEIKSVEVITNPGAMYDATVSAVVRIKTLRRQGDGFGFDLNVNSNNDLRYGYYNPSGTLNLRYRHNSLDLFGSVNYWNWSTVTDATAQQRSYITKNGNLTELEQDSKLRDDWTGWGMNYNLGFNWQLSDNHSVGMRIDRHDKYDAGYTATIDNYVTERTATTSPADAGERYSHGTQDNREELPYSWNGNAYYTGMFGKLGVDLNIDFLLNKTTGKTDIEEYDVDMVTMSSDSYTRNSLFADKLVLSYPLWQGQLQVGTEMSFVRRKSGYNFVGDMVPNTASEVEENNIAAFAEYACMIPKVGNVSAGLRYEHVGFDYTDLINADGSMSRRTDDLFPSVSWANQWGSFQVALSYSYKTERPNYWMLNEAVTYINQYSLQTGDPKLKNAKINTLGLNARWKWAVLFMSYERRDDALTQWSYIYNDAGVILIKNINLPSPMRSFTLGVNVSPTWGIYSANWTAGLQKFNYKQTLADPREATGSREVRYDTPIGFFNLNNAIRLNSWQFEANMSITTRGDVMNYQLTAPRYALDFVVQKCWLKNDALCLRAAIYDVLQRNSESVRMDCGYYTLSQKNLRDRHRFELSLRYTFNAASNKYKGTGAGKDVIGRMSK